MKQWIFKIFGEKESDVDIWLNGLPPKAQARMDTIISYMEITRDWTRTPYFSTLQGHKGINEIKFTFQNKQYRPLGCYGPENNEFTLLIGAMEQGNRFNPISAPLIAEKRRKEILSRRKGTHEY